MEFSLADAPEILHAALMQRWLPAILLVVLLAGFRILGSTLPEKIPNAQPLLAILLCSWIFLKGSQRWLIPFVVWVVTDPITSLLQGYPIFGWHHVSIALGVATTVWIASLTRRNTLAVILSAAAAACAFYFVTNLASFVVDPRYTKSAAGFLQAEWTGAPGAMPTWIFLRNSLAANLLFTGLFLAARHSLPLTARKSTEALA